MVESLLELEFGAVLKAAGGNDTLSLFLGDQGAGESYRLNLASELGRRRRVTY